MLNKIAKLAVAAGGLFLVTACATGTTDLTLSMSEEAKKPGLISEADAVSIYLAPVTDSRDEEMKNRIGDKRNGYGMVMGAVGTTEPVTDIVKDTVSSTFTSNNHGIVDDAAAADFTVETDVDRFWFDYKTGLVTVEFFGDVQVDLTVKDAAGEVVFEEAFKGYYSDKTGGGLSKTWTRVMNAALDDLSKEISLSQDLFEVLTDVISGDSSEDGEPIS